MRNFPNQVIQSIKKYYFTFEVRNDNVAKNNVIILPYNEHSMYKFEIIEPITWARTIKKSFLILFDKVDFGPA